jgi:hypothetical protein
MTDEHLTSGRASTVGTIIAITWVYMANHVEEKMVKRATWWPRKSTNMEMSFPSATAATRQRGRRPCEALLKGQCHEIFHLQFFRQSAPPGSRRHA